jgi:uncharacterized protein YgbK (DUF1537 family)
MNGLLIGYYGDDFTGSTDAMEALARNGVKTVLFLRPPTSDDLKRFPDIQAFGIAGVSRSMSPQDMEAELMPAFRALQQSGVPIVHYKTCSTFDSSPHTGSIGKAIEIACTVFTEQRFVPLLVGVPQLRRYTVFGHHYGSVGDRIHRLDRHPIMSQHPVTPMDEADLLRHLSRQTKLSAGLINILELGGTLAESTAILERRLSEDHDIILFDVLDQEHLQRAGKLIAKEAEKTPLFVVGSSGVEYALTPLWRKAGRTLNRMALAEQPQDNGPIAVVSGSCSQTTEDQRRYAEQHGFRSMKIAVEPLADPIRKAELLDQVQVWAEDQLSAGYSVIVYTASGPADDSIMRAKPCNDGAPEASNMAEQIGSALGQICRLLIEQSGIRRIVVAGGDTSGYVTRKLGIYALESIALVDPGIPLCRAYADDPKLENIELALKGGQVGKLDNYVKIRHYF